MSESDHLEDIVEIHADQIDVEAIMRTIRANLQKRREAARTQGLDFEALAAGSFAPDRGRFDASVYANLRRANATFDRIAVSQYVSPRPVPIIGGLIQRARGALHQVVVYYVNMLAGKQILFNESIVTAVTGLVAGLEQNAELAALRAEVQALQARVATLESAREAK